MDPDRRRDDEKLETSRSTKRSKNNQRGASIAMERPLSPFMFPMWYRFQITSLLSIVHRLTGVALAVGSILLAWWLVAVAAAGEGFAGRPALIASPVRGRPFFRSLGACS